MAKTILDSFLRHGVLTNQSMNKQPLIQSDLWQLRDKLNLTQIAEDESYKKRQIKKELESVASTP